MREGEGTASCSPSSAGERRGEQRPTRRVVTAEAAYTDGPDACELGEQAGIVPFPWQRDVISDWLARDSRDRPACVSAGLTLPRQNGKNAVLEICEDYWLVACGYHVLHTAHRVKTTKKSFRRLVRYFTDKRNPELASMVESVRYTNGEEAIYLTNGGSIEFSSRTTSGGRGFDDIQVVVFDEAQELTDSQLSAILYTLSASSTGDRQLVFTGTSPGPDSPGETFSRMRDAMLSADPPRRQCWHEWGTEVPPPREKPPFPEIVGEVYKTNPSMGYVLDEEFTETEYATADVLGFWVERLGWQIPKRRDSPKLDPEAWDACAVGRDGVPKAGKLAFAVKFAPDGSEVALVGCRLPGGGRPHVELAGTGSMADGMGWLTSFLCDPDLCERVAAVAVDGRRGSEALLQALSGAYPRRALMAPGTRGITSAATMLADAVREGELTHWADPEGGQAPLDESARTSVERPVGTDGGWSFGGEHSTAIEAASLALWAARTTKRDPEGGCEVY